MFYLGIDVSKKTHRVVIIDNYGEKASKSFSIKSSSEDFENLLNYLKEHNLSPENLLAGLEATGNFWKNIYSYLTNKKFSVTVINPRQTTKFREALRKKAKTGDIDALVMAEMLRSGEYAFMSLKKISRLSANILSNSITA